MPGDGGSTFCLCVTMLLLASGCGSRAKALVLSPVCKNTFGLQYRVLREPRASRGAPRSVDRKCVGRNALSVKGLSPDNRVFMWWPSKYAVAKAASFTRRGLCWPIQRRVSGTTGVLDHGMYTRSAVERERSASGRIKVVRPRSRVSGQGVMSKSKTIPDAEVRCLHSSEEVE